MPSFFADKQAEGLTPLGYSSNPPGPPGPISLSQELMMAENSQRQTPSPSPTPTDANDFVGCSQGFETSTTSRCSPALDTLELGASASTSFGSLYNMPQFRCKEEVKDQEDQEVEDKDEDAGAVAAVGPTRYIDPDLEATLKWFADHYDDVPSVPSSQGSTEEFGHRLDLDYARQEAQKLEEWR